MAKSALGKGLGQLMAGQQAPARNPSPAPSISASVGKVTPVDFGRGLNTLVAPQPEKAPEVSKTKVLLPAWFFFAADFLLLSYTVVICLDADRPMLPGEIIFAAIATGLGAVLAIVGVLRGLPAE